MTTHDLAPENEMDPTALALAERFREMSKEELLEDIFRHEKEHRGIDWRALYAQGSSGRLEAWRLAQQYLERLTQAPGASAEIPAEIPEITKQFLAALQNDDVKPMPQWAIDLKEANAWRNASGDDLERKVLHVLKTLQALELTNTSAGWATLMTGIGVVAWMKKGYDFYKVARLEGLSKLASIANSIKNMTVAASRAFIVLTILVVLAVVILYLLEKEAVVYTVLINMTDETLEMDELEVTIGKQTVQFEEPLESTKALLKRSHIAELGHEEDSYWVGLFSAQKKNMALTGSQGAYNFKATQSIFPNRVFVGWEIPLVLFANRCLVSADFKGSVGDFAKKANKDGSLDSQSTAGRGVVRARMHSGTGSKGYMSVIFDTVTT